MNYVIPQIYLSSIMFGYHDHKRKFWVFIKYSFGVHCGLTAKVILAVMLVKELECMRNS